MSLISRILKANPSAQVSDMLTGYFVIPSAKDSFFPDPGTRGLTAGGDTGSASNVIDYVNIATTGNAVDFGDLTAGRGSLCVGSVASTTRGLFMGGYTNTPVNIIDYVTILTTGNATDFGDLTAVTLQGASHSSRTRGLRMGGASSITAVIDYVAIATTGNATSFGTLTLGRASHGVGNSTRAIAMGGSDVVGTPLNTIDYVTIATLGNATDFGDFIRYAGNCGTASSNTRGVAQTGFLFTSSAISNLMDYITIASTGNSTTFGDATINRQNQCGTGTNTRGIFMGGRPGSINTIDYITIATTGNAIDFGDLTTSTNAPGATSNGHGGLH